MRSAPAAAPAPPAPPAAPAPAATRNGAVAGELRALLPEGTGPPAGVPAEIFAAAVDTFVAGQRLDMRSLARRAGVARATLYRRVGNREQLLDELLWWRARRLLADQIQATAGLDGANRLTEVIGGVLAGIGRDRPLRTFLESDPETALRLLTGNRSTVHQGTARVLERLIDTERGRGSFRATLDSPTLAYAIVRISEGFLYSDVIADRVPDIDRAVTVIEALLLGLDLASLSRA